MVRWRAEAEDASFRALHIPIFRVLTNLTLCLRELILLNVLITNWARLCFHVWNESLVIDFNRQDLWALMICVERMLVSELLLRRSRTLAFMLSRGIVLFGLICTILRREILPWEDSLLLRATTASFYGNHYLPTLVILLVNGVVPVHLDHLTDLDGWVSSVTVLIVILLLKIVLMSAVVWPSE